MLFSLVACGKGQTGEESEKPKYDYDSGSLENMLAFITTTGETANTTTTAEADALIEKLGDSYETYDAHKAEVTAFYEAAQSRSAELYVAFQACSMQNKLRNLRYSTMITVKSIV